MSAHDLPMTRRTFLALSGFVLPSCCCYLGTGEKPAEDDSYQKRLARLADNSGLLQNHHRRWVGVRELRNFLESADTPEILAFQRAIGMIEPTAKKPKGQSPQERAEVMLDHFLWNTTNTLKYPFLSTNDIKYHETVLWVAEKLKIPPEQVKRASTFEAEREILKQAFAATWDKLNKQQRLELLERIDPKGEIPEETGKDAEALAALGGSAAIATLSKTVAFYGFGFYTAMSKTIAFAAGIFGLTLPFGVYTSASTIVSVLAGPVGWLLAGVLAVLGAALFGSANVQKAANFILQVHLLKVAALKAKGVSDGEIFGQRSK